MTTLAQHLEREQASVRSLKNLETRARRVRRDIALYERALAEMQTEREHLFVTLSEEYGWTNIRLSQYFKLDVSKQRIHQRKVALKARLAETEGND